jgi:hypothetical protein
MDLLGGYGSSSDEEDQPVTTTATPPLKVNPSRKEVWSENFKKIKEFYEEKKHLTLPSKDLEYARLSQWLIYQRHRSMSLRKDQLERLESINYKTTKLHREKDDVEWEVKYNRLKEIYNKTGSTKIKENERGLSCWLSKQKRLLRNNLLDPTRQARLGKLGIHPSTTKCRRKKSRMVSKKLEEKWQSQLEKLKEYHRIKGNCNVPRGWKEDPTLGTWNNSQRIQYAKNETGEAVMDSERIQKLEQLGFAWSTRMSDKKSKRKLMMINTEETDAHPDRTQKLEQRGFGATTSNGGNGLTQLKQVNVDEIPYNTCSLASSGEE